MRITSSICISIITVFSYLNASATDFKDALSTCQPTPEVTPWHIPFEPIQKHANLRRKTGQAATANGTPIILKGRLLDSECVPIPNATIQIWQTDKHGHFKEFYTPKNQWDAVPKSYDANFAYSGTARTNNLGEFTFLSIFPGRGEEFAPHINYTIRHRDFNEFSSKLFFDNHPANKDDIQWQSVKETKQPLITAKGESIDSSDLKLGRIFRFNITLEGISKYNSL